jgi:hypothetical protein
MTAAAITREQAALAIFAAMMSGPGAKVSPHGDLGIAQKEIEVAFALAETFVKVADKQRGEQVPPPTVRETETETLTWFDEMLRRRVSTFPKGSLPPGMSDQSPKSAGKLLARANGTALDQAIDAVLVTGGTLLWALTEAKAVPADADKDFQSLRAALLDLQTEWHRKRFDDELTMRVRTAS